MSKRFQTVMLLTLISLLFVSGCERTPEQAAAAPDAGRSESVSPGAEPLTVGRPRRPEAPASARQPGEFTTLANPKRAPRELELVSVAVDKGPMIDGGADDAAWLSASELTTLDRASQQDIRIRSVHTGDKIFMLVSYEDAAASEEHKTWIWAAEEGIYKQGLYREDAFVFKFSMSGNNANLSLFRNPTPHTADVWFWKACRTNPMGYADDKHQVLGTAPGKDARRIELADGNKLYLQRAGDAGRSAYTSEMIFEYRGDSLPRFQPRQPEGSRADVRAKGRWRDGRWTIEFARKLDTGNDDDLAFAIGHSYLFGVSRYEMSFDEPIPEFTQPLYRTGDVYDRLLLTIGR